MSAVTLAPALDEVVARATRIAAQAKTTRPNWAAVSDFDKGRFEGYLQTISLATGLPLAAIRQEIAR